MDDKQKKMLFLIKKLIVEYKHAVYRLSGRWTLICKSILCLPNKIIFSDHRTDDLFLIHNPIPVFIILLLYYHFIYNFGPRFMQNRKPFKLKKLLIAYNIFQIAANAYIVFKARNNYYLSSKVLIFLFDKSYFVTERT